MTDYNHETFYKLLQDNKFDELLELENIYREKIIDDVMIKPLFDKYLINSVLSYILTLDDDIYSSFILKKIYNRFIQHRNRTYSMLDKDFEELASKYIHILNKVGKKSTAYSISKNWKHLEEVKIFIEEYDNSNPKELEHSNSLNIKISENTNIKKKKSTIELFKSTQEYEFFHSIRKYYPTYFTYPNVALSCLIDFNGIKNELNKEESNYFFMAVIDCVVFDIDSNNYIPMYFFELDSFFHDEIDQARKDRIKDKIFSLAGEKLYRIRSKDNRNLKRDDFKKLIEEILVNQKM